MPTYEYHCEACQHDFESFHAMSAAPIKKCPKCGKNKVKRLIGAGAGLIFKGSGFYITDYREAGYQESAKADKAPTTDAKPAGDGKAAETKSDAKTDAKPETKSDGKSAESKPTETKPAAAAPAETKPAAKSESKPSSSAAKKKSK